MLKNFFKLFTIIVFAILSLTGCSYNSARSISSDIEIFDYKNICVDSSYLELTENDINTIIYMDFAANDYYNKTDKETIENEDVILIDVFSENDLYSCENYYYEVGCNEIYENFDQIFIGNFSNAKIETVIPDTSTKINIVIKGIYTLYDINNQQALLNFYGYDSIEKTMEYIEDRAVNEIIYNYMWETIKENSKITTFPDYVEDEITSRLKELSQEAENENLSLDEYLNYLGSDVNAVKQDIYNYYYDLIIAESILSKENKSITKKDIISCTNDLADKNKTTSAIINEYFSEEDIYYIAVMSKLESILLSYIIINE